MSFGTGNFVLLIGLYHIGMSPGAHVMASVLAQDGLDVGGET